MTPRGPGRWGKATPLREWMREHGWRGPGTRVLARELRVTRTALETIASGTRAPDEELAARILERTGVHVPTDAPLYPPPPPRIRPPRARVRGGTALLAAWLAADPKRQRRLARAADVEPDQVRGWARGYAVPSPAAQLVIERVAGIESALWSALPRALRARLDGAVRALLAAGPEGLTGAQLGLSTSLLFTLEADGQIAETRLGWVHAAHVESRAEAAA